VVNLGFKVPLKTNFGALETLQRFITGAIVIVNMSLEQAYDLILKRIPKTQQIDSLNVVKQVEQYRQFWKPKPASVLLLAESHVYTTEEEFAAESNQYALDNFVQNYPTHYVRFVYCLGYGEPEILKTGLESNRGRTSQFWKIFSSCVAKTDNDLGFQRILAGKTSLHQRLRNKVSILQEMKRRGIWLLDASIVGIYGAVKNQYAKETIITTCWDAHLKNVIIESSPKHIIVIGKGVEGTLRLRLNMLKASLGFTYSVLPQPQGNRGTSEEQLETYKEYRRICSKYAN
jgi:hypothetical protein